MRQPTYYIRVEIDDEKDEKTQDTLLDYVNITACNSEANQPSLTMEATPLLASGAIAGLLQPVSVDYRTIMRGLAQQINNFCITKGQKLHVVMKQPNDAQGHAQPDIANDVILIENPLDRFCGGGYGKVGLEAIECYSPLDDGVAPWPPLQPPRQGNGDPQPGAWYLRITKANHPGLTAEHVRAYFSFGQYVYCQTMVDATNPVSINNTTQYWFDVWGPTIIRTDNVGLTAPNAAAGNVYQPVVKLYTKHGQPYRVGNKVYGEVTDVNDPAETIEVSATVTVLDGSRKMLTTTMFLFSVTLPIWDPVVSMQAAIGTTVPQVQTGLALTGQQFIILIFGRWERQCRTSQHMSALNQTSPQDSNHIMASSARIV